MTTPRHAAAVVAAALGALREGRLLRRTTTRFRRGELLGVCADPARLSGPEVVLGRLLAALGGRVVSVRAFATLHSARVAALGAVFFAYDAADAVLGRCFARCFAHEEGPLLVGLTHVLDPRRDPVRLADVVLANTRAAAQRIRDERTLVLHPPLPDWARPETMQARADGPIVQVNMSKAPEVFQRLVRALPGREFIAIVGGYGNQSPPTGPNVRRVAAAPGAVEAALRGAALLVSPIEESYGLVAAEAVAGGMPVLMHDSPSAEEVVGCRGGHATHEQIDAGHHEWPTLVERILGDWERYATMARARSEVLWARQADELASVRAVLEEMWR